MRLSLLLVFALAALAAAADAKKCSGKCVAVGACAGKETKGSCEDSQVCCVAEKNVGVKRNCNPTRKCNKLKGECRKKNCLPGEVKFRNKGRKVYCEGKKKCVCCSRSCENKSACNLKGGYCQPITLPCDGDLMTGKAFCKANKKLKEEKKNKCGCCVPKAPIAPTAGPPAAPEWGYKGEGGPENWATLFPNFCAGSSQSPIALNGLEATATSSSDAWVLEKYDTVPDDMKIENNGHSAKVAWTITDVTQLPSVSGGKLGGKYTFAQFHFHWGSISTQGSEHTINGIAYAAELHLVHFKTEYGSLGNAIAYEDGLAVLGIMLLGGLIDNPDLTPIIDGLATIKNSGDEEYLATKFPLQDLLPANTNTFYRYQGSLTTPTCNEIVTWTVFQDPITISESQLEQFRGLLGDDGEHHIEDNYRPVLPLNGRTVEKITVS
ncbi:carbonic anhydrase 1-like [Penaeus japonicus]|uniref:carbonic anhydrase 1-like n=1 Tax=Penaeus japonicus TaxID=27405 RepID=UPI001C716BF6|nr:carbonic anhydrase 1-like [Penaeus japonicus]